MHPFGKAALVAGVVAVFSFLFTLATSGWNFQGAFVALIGVGNLVLFGVVLVMSWGLKHRNPIAYAIGVAFLSMFTYVIVVGIGGSTLGISSVSPASLAITFGFILAAATFMKVGFPEFKGGRR